MERASCGDGTHTHTHVLQSFDRQSSLRRQRTATATAVETIATRSGSRITHLSDSGEEELGYFLPFDRENRDGTERETQGESSVRADERGNTERERERDGYDIGVWYRETTRRRRTTVFDDLNDNSSVDFHVVSSAVVAKTQQRRLRLRRPVAGVL